MVGSKPRRAAEPQSRSAGPRTPSGAGGVSVPHTGPASTIPASSDVVYGYGRPKPGLISGLAAIFGGWTGAPRSTTPWQYGPRSFVGPSGAAAQMTHLGNEGDFVPGASVWGPRAGDQGFPHGSAWPGYPEDWEVPFFTRPDDHVSNSTLTKRVSTVWSCVDLISRQLSTMPTKITKDSRPQDPRPWQTNPEPLLYASWVDFSKAMINSMLMRGRAFLACTARYSDGYPARFIVLNPDLVRIDAAGDGRNTYWLGKPGEGIRIEDEDILHLRYQTWPGDPYGIGPLEASWRNIASAEAMSGYASAMSGRGGVPNAVLESDATLTQEQAGALKGSWRQMIASNGFEPVILTKGLHYKPLSLSARELALIDHRIFDEQRIASAFGVPLWLVGLPMADGLTYSTVEGTWDFFWRSNLRTFAHNIALGMSQWLLPADVFLRYIADELIRPQILQRAQSYEILIRSGVMTPAEARIEEGMGPLTDHAQQPITEETLSTQGKQKEGTIL